MKAKEIGDAAGEEKRKKGDGGPGGLRAGNHNYVGEDEGLSGEGKKRKDCGTRDFIPSGGF